jgi:hypothetical protein
MTATTTQTTPFEQQFILELKIDSSGNVTRKKTKLGRKDTLEGKLLGQIYPGIRVARVSVPFELTSYEQSVVENRMANLRYGGEKFELVGASGSAKEGKFYFVDHKHAKPIAERFQHWPEAAIVYFAILVSDCQLMIEEANLRIAVVEDHILGTNDCRGWARESLYRKLKLNPKHFCQFRLAFDTREPKQAKGALKAMSDRVADKLSVDIILPESACKPALKGEGRFIPELGAQGRMYDGQAILGIKAISRESEFGSSYTLIEHASEYALEMELKLWALKRIKMVRKAWDEGDYEKLFEVIGKSDATPIDDSVSFNPDTLEAEPAGEGCDPVEAVLLADRSGTAIKIPYIFNQLNRRMARWAYRACTGADLRLPSFALADDGILIEHRGKVISASDWMPEDGAITSLTAEKGLCVRYPIRMQEDLLPARHLTDLELIPMLKSALDTPDLDDALARYILGHQLRLEGTYLLHSETAARNGGDFDFDTICVMSSDQFPKFIEGRIAYGEQFQQEKTKHKKLKSPWWNACPVAMKARGNRIGSITDLKTSCIAAGRPDLAYQLVEQLQNALDALKHKVVVDENIISDIRNQVSAAPWLRYKRERRVSDLPAHLDVADTDKVGRLYNVLRKELGFLPDDAGDGFEEKMTVDHILRGLFTGEEVTREMFEECQLVNSIYADIASRIVEREDVVKQELKQAQAHWESVRKSEDKELKRSVVLARNHAQAAVWEHEQDAKEQFSSLNLFLHYWAQGKEDARAWAQAMNAVVTSGKGSGAVLFQAFPQQVVDAFAEATGGQRMRVRQPKTVNGYVNFDDQRRAFLIERIEQEGDPDGEKRIFLFQYQGKRSLTFDNTGSAASLQNP